MHEQRAWIYHYELNMGHLEEGRGAADFSPWLLY